MNAAHDPAGPTQRRTEVESSIPSANIQPIRAFSDASLYGRSDPGGVFVAQHASRGLVISDPYAPCRGCSSCVDGLPEACLQRRCPGRGEDEGGLAERQSCAEELLIDLPSDIDPDVAIWSSEAATALGAMRSVVPGDRHYVSVVGDSAAAILAGELGSQRDSRFRLLCQRQSTLKEAERRGIRARLLSEAGQHGDQDVLVLLDGALDVPNLCSCGHGGLILCPPWIFRTTFRQQLRSCPPCFPRSFWVGCCGPSATDLPNILALDCRQW